MNSSFPRLLLLFFAALLICGQSLMAQTDSVPALPGKALRLVKDSSLVIKDSSTVNPAAPAADTSKRVPIIAEPDTSLQHFYRLNENVNVKAPLVFRSEPSFSAKEKDLVFYLLLGLLFVLGFIRLVFWKYFNDLFRIFFQTTFRQKSIREQLLQNKMASLLLNIFFCISGGLFLYFLAHYKGWLQADGFIKKALLCIALVTIVYSVKYIGLKISGWLFGMEEVTETYLFIVFLINKVVGVLLLPATMMLALGSNTLQPVLLIISLLGLMILYLYRYLIALPLVRNHSALTGFHFFIYLCAFEVVPVLLIYKLLLLILSK
jgi:hypothetical protein